VLFKNRRCSHERIPRSVLDLFEVDSREEFNYFKGSEEEVFKWADAYLSKCV